MKYTIIALAAIALSISIVIAEAPAPQVVYTQKPVSLREIVASKSKEYGVSESTMVKIINCENREWDTTLQSRIISNGVREDSWGLSQIHLPSHPNVTKEQATDPEFAIDFMAKNIAKGRIGMWSCARILGMTQ